MLIYPYTVFLKICCTDKAPSQDTAYYGCKFDYIEPYESKKGLYPYKHYYEFNSTDNNIYRQYIIFSYMIRRDGTLYVKSNYKKFSDNDDNNNTSSIIESISFIIEIITACVIVIMIIVIIICILKNKRKKRVGTVENALPQPKIEDKSFDYIDNYPSAHIYPSPD